MANENIQELKFQVGEAWKGVYSSSTAYGLANVVQDATGLSIYRSLKSGNVGHPVSDRTWWFCIIDMSSIKTESDRIAALNQSIAQDEVLRVAAEELRQQHEEARIAAETQRNEAEQARINAEQQRVTKETQRNTAEQNRITAEQSRVSAESARVTAEQARVLAETLRANAEDQRAANEQNRVAAEQQRIERAEQDHQRAESDHATYVDSLGAFDISSYHATDGVLAKYADLTAALGTNGANIPDDLRKGGMSVKFVQSSDNNYVKFFCMAQNFTTDVTLWQGVDNRPMSGSKNLTESGGTADIIAPLQRTSNIVDLNCYPLHLGAVMADDHWRYDGTDKRLHKVVPLDENWKSLTITANSQVGTYYMFTSEYVEPTINDNDKYVPNRIGDREGVDVGTTEEIIIPDNARYIIININNNNPYLNTPESVIPNVKYTYKNLAEEFNIKILDAKTNLNKVGFIGKGSIYSGHTYKGVLQKNHKYRFKVLTPSWSMPEGSSATGFKFAIQVYTANESEVVRVADVRANDTVATEYKFTTPDIDGLYFSIGGRIAEGSNVDVLFEDISLKEDYDVTKVLGWPNVFNKTNAPYKARLASNGTESASGTKYVYIFPVNDYIRINAGINNSKYTIITAIHDTLEGAKVDSYATKHAFGKGLAWSGSQEGSSSYRYGDSTVNSGFLMVAIYKIDGTAITDEEVTEINNGLWLDFYPLNSSKKTDNNEDAITLLEGGRLSVADFEFSAFSSDGICINEPVRAKFFKENLRPNTQFSVKINSSVFEAIPNIVWAAEMYSTLGYAMGNKSAGRLQSFFDSWQTTDPADNLIINVSGVLDVYFKKSDNSSFAHSELEALKAGVEIYVSDVSAQIEGSDEQYNELPLGQFVNQSGEYETLSDSTTIVSSPYITCVPYLGVTYKFVLPNGIRARFVYGTRNTLGSVTGWVGNGEQVVIPSNQMTQRLQFDKNGSTLTAEEITTAYNSGLIKVLYKNIDNSVEERNYDNEKYVKAALLRLGWADISEVYAKQGLNAMPIFAHISDLHGDFKRFENCVEYAKYLGVDALVATGDNVVYNAINGSKYLLDIITQHSGVPFVSCIGNHEVDQANTVTQEYLFNNFISPYITQGSYKKDADTVADNAYYYIDFVSKNIRLIVLNQYDNGCYYGSGLGGRLGQSQITWLCNTLLSTPSGYGVIIAMHANEARVNTPQNMNNWNQTVNLDGRSEDEYGYCVNGLFVNTIRPIRTIVDAFISKDSSFSMTYQENTVNGNNGETVTVSNIDFSSVAEGVEFICYFTGHRHCDNIGYVDGAVNKQLMLNVVCGNPHYPRISPLSFSEGCDLPRGDRGITQDAFNVYAIDRQNGRVKIARVGSSVNFEGIERKFLIAPYRD